MATVRTPLVAVLAGMVAGVGLAAALVAGGALRVPVARDYTDASEPFLAAWERSRTGTFVVDADFRRTLADGRTLYSSSQLVQRPPDRILRQFGGIDGQIDGHPIVCSTDQNDHFACITGEVDAPPADQELREELDTFRSYFGGDAPLYQVIRAPAGEGCFELIQRIVYPDPTYGRYAQLCFDEGTGALRRLERHLEGGVVETLEAVSIRTEVTGNDFSLDQDDDFDLRMDVEGGFDPVLGTTPAGSAVPPAEDPGGAPAEDPTAAPAPSVDELRLLDSEDLVAAGSAAIRLGRAPDPYVAVLVERLEAGTFSINDSVWRDPTGGVTELAEPMVLDLLRRGARPGP